MRRGALIAALLVVVLMGMMPLVRETPYIEALNFQQEQHFQVAQEIGGIIYTEHGSKTYLGDNNWRYRSSVGETNTWNGSHYLRYVYDLENKQVSIGRLTFTHGPNGVISVSHSGSGSMIGELKWYAQYYLSDQWNNFTFDNYEYLGATKTDENATIRQRWWSTNGELNVSYTYYYWNELKMRAQATNLAAQTVPVRVLWALTDIKITPDYTLVYDNGVAVGVEIGNEQSIYWHDVTQTAPEININPILDKENRRAAVVFGNMSSILAQGETMDIDPTYTVAADIDDDDWANPYGSPTHFTSHVYIWFANDTNGPSSWYSRGQLRISLSILKDTTILSAELFGYESYDEAGVSHNCYRIDETNVGSLEGDSSMPSVDKTPTVQWNSDGVSNEWSPSIDITDIVQEQVNLAGWVSGYYLGLAFETPSQSAVNRHAFEDYQGAGTNHAYVDIIEQEGEYDYVDVISDLHTPSDTGTHSDFAEMQDKDGTFDTLTEADTGGGSEWLDNNGHDGLYSDGQWTLTGSNYLYSQDQPTNIIETKLDGAYEGYFSFPDTSFSYGELTMNITAYGNADDGATGEFCYFHWGHNGTYYTTANFGFSTVYSYKTVTVAETFTTAEINAMQGWFEYDKSGGADEIRVDHLRLGISQGVNYDLDLEVGWLSADYDETSEELCIFGGTQGSEALRVDVWSGSWTNVFTDIAAGWNNISVTSYLTDATFEIRFTDTSDDAVEADTWQVEAVLLHTWSGGIPYEKDLTEGISAVDVQTNSADYDRSYTESVSAVDVRTTAADMARNLVESIGVVGVLTMLRGREKDLVESITAADVRTFSIDYARNLVEAVSCSDVWSKTFGLNRTEAISVVDSGEFSKFISKNMTEVIGVADSMIRSVDYSREMTENITVADVRTLSAGFARNLVESINVVDIIDTEKGAGIDYEKDLAESITVSSELETEGGVVVQRSIIYELFLSLEVWGYLGPALLVIGGYVLSKRELILGVLWFVLECLVVAQYLLLVDATPNYWWHIYIILIGGLITFGFAMMDRRR